MTACMSCIPANPRLSWGAAETFTSADAVTVERWAAANGLAELLFWNLQNDNAAASHVKQSPYQYSHSFEPFTSSAVAASSPLAAVSAPAQHGNFRSASCPSATFCMAVDDSGNNALTWDGTAWSGTGFD
jgi:chitinase